MLTTLDDTLKNLLKEIKVNDRHINVEGVMQAYLNNLQDLEVFLE